MVCLYKAYSVLTIANVYVFHSDIFIIIGTAECTAIDAFNHAGENIVFASGSPFENVDLGNYLLILFFLAWKYLVIFIYFSNMEAI